jgi:hypothetical protein
VFLNALADDLSEHPHRRSPAPSATWAPGCGKPFNTIGCWTVADLGSDGVGTVTRFSDNIESNGQSLPRSRQDDAYVVREGPVFHERPPSGHDIAL